LLPAGLAAARARRHGRGLRTADGKDDCLILDHSDNHLRLGFVTDIHHDELADGKPRVKAEPKAIEALPKKCPSCSFLKPPRLLECPSCGFKPEPKCSVVNAAGELVELTDRNTVNAVSEAKEKVRFYQELKGYAAARGYQRGWAAHKIREKWKHWPSGLEHLPPISPSPSTASWIKSRNIAWAKANARAS
jgi:DNA repair protein RadD